MNLVSNISERLKYALNLRNMKQSELVEKTGIGKSSISTYLNGEYKPKQDKILLLAKALDVNETWLMGYDVSIKRIDFEKINDGCNNQTKSSNKESKLLINFNKLNDLGQEEATKRVEELTEIPKYTIDKVDENKITPFKQPEQPKEKVKIIARGEGITYIDKEELDEIKRNSTVLSDEDFHKYF